MRFYGLNLMVFYKLFQFICKLFQRHFIIFLFNYGMSVCTSFIFSIFGIGFLYFRNYLIIVFLIFFFILFLFNYGMSVCTSFIFSIFGIGFLYFRNYLIIVFWIFVFVCNFLCCCFRIFRVCC